MAKFKSESGETSARALMAYMLADTLENLNVGKTMNDVQVARACDLILDEFYFLKPDDFKLCFNRVLAGKYGQIYDRVDIQVIFGWLNKYCDERIMEADNISYNEHLSNDKIMAIDPGVLEHLNKSKEKYHANTF